MARILYLSTIFNQPKGGVRTIFHHVRELRRLGHEAFVVRTGGDARPGWFEADAPLLDIKPSLALHQDDVLVLPEVAGDTLRDVLPARCRKVLFCQNHFEMFEGLRELPGWPEIGVDYALYCSQPVAEAVNACFSFRDWAVARCGVDRAIFRPAAVRRLQVAVMPRKRPRDVLLIRRIFERRWPALARHPWVALRQADEHQVAATLAEAGVFLALGQREGLGLPPLEAMAGGCLVAGFTGHGGRDYATAENGFWVEEDDVFAAAEAVAQALLTLIERPERAAAMRAAGAATVARYSFAGLRDDLKTFWGRMMGEA